MEQRHVQWQLLADGFTASQRTTWPGRGSRAYQPIESRKSRQALYGFGLVALSRGTAPGVAPLEWTHWAHPLFS